MSIPCPHGGPHRHPGSTTEAVFWTLLDKVVATHVVVREAKRRGVL